MRAVYFEEFGDAGQLKIGELSTPLPVPGEVQIKVIYTSVNPVDWKIRMGLLQKRIPHQFPIIPGWDASGVISAISPGIDKFKIGDEVYCYCRKPTVQNGTYAEYVCCPAKDVAFKPHNLSFAQATAIPLVGLTAWQSLFDAAKLQKGESILIQAGAGGVGSLAIQFAKIAGAYVLTTARASNHPYVKSLGADLAIDYQSKSLKEEIKKAVPKGLDVVFDTVGGETLKESYQLLKPGGRIVSIVEPPNKELAAQFNINPFYVFVEPNGKQLQQIADLIQSGKVIPIKVEEMPLENAAEAQEKNQLRHGQGKIVLKI
jgi:NADPH:quinone reductase-like Zn-dependent oxidoreductase